MIGKYKFQFKPLNATRGDAEIVVSIDVPGTFDGSRVTLLYRFTIETEKILSLTID